MTTTVRLGGGEVCHAWPDCELDGVKTGAYRLQVPAWQECAFKGSGPFAAWRAEIPNCVIETVNRYPEHLRWGVLQLAGKSGMPEWFSTLVHDYPMLPTHLLVLRHHELLHLPSLWGGLRRFLRATSILPPAVFRRIPHRWTDPMVLGCLERAWPGLERNTRMALCTSRAITIDTALCLSELPRCCLTPALVRACEASEQWNVMGACKTILELRTGPWVHGHLSSWEAFERIARRLRLRERLHSLPRPPFAGGNGITPISTTDALMAEGEEMGNCIAEYYDEICGCQSSGRRRKGYAYRVDWPGRATLYLVCEYGTETWSVADIRGLGDGPPDGQTVDHVNRWLERNGMTPVDRLFPHNP